MSRPIFRYYGGKWVIAPWIISHFPPHQAYVEPFGGGASVLLRKEPAPVEVYNDLDGEIVNVFRVLRNPQQAEELLRLMRLTPYARAEFRDCYLKTDDPIERARRTLFRSAASANASGVTCKSRCGFSIRRNSTSPARSWAVLPEELEPVIARLREVIIEESPAIDIIQRYDTPQTLFYVDPPYPHQTRNRIDTYRVEMTENDHRELAAVLRRCAGYVIISGYACALYDQELYPDWQRVEHKTFADGARPRTEVLWLSPIIRHIQLPLLQP